MVPDEEFDATESTAPRTLATVMPPVDTTADLATRVDELTQRIADLERELADLRRSLAA
jgi:hypothetical protein